ncbi:MAG: translation initiation inhibitor [Herbaspirillum sp.]|nr:translation initiation inhibitor [Herbaspirillum sp.]
MSDVQSDVIYHVFQDGPVKVAPYSHAVQSGEWLFLTGQMPIGPDGLVPEGIEAQTRTVIANLRSVMDKAGFGGGDVVQVRVFLTRFEAHYERMNAVYATLFDAGKWPARTCVGVTALARQCEIEIDAIVKRSA